jgi:hypothetical protein
MGARNIGRQKIVSQRHDAGAGLARDIAKGLRSFEQLDATTWTIDAANGKGKHVTKRENCKRICSVSFGTCQISGSLRLCAKPVVSVLTNSAAIAQMRL